MKKFNQISVALGLMVILSACGSQSSTDLANISNNSVGNAPNNNNNGGTPTGNIYGLPVAPETLVYLTGSTGTKPSKTFYADTSMKLRVKVTAQSAANNTVYSNWINPYGCFRVNVTVNGITMQTQILRVHGLTDSNCANAPTSEILDFTQYMSGNGTPVTITFSDAEYDNCRYTDPFAYGGPQCGMKPLFPTHQAKFKAAIQVDGQYME
jgi:hypothetical protein